ncbi:hypothetical protein D3C75_1027210 [compost metagenome]
MYVDTIGKFIVGIEGHRARYPAQIRPRQDPAKRVPRQPDGRLIRLDSPGRRYGMDQGAEQRRDQQEKRAQHRVTLHYTGRTLTLEEAGLFDVGCGEVSVEKWRRVGKAVVIAGVVASSQFC